MLSEKQLTALATLAKVEPAKLKAAIADEKEVEVELADDLTAFTTAEVTTLKENEYKRAKTASVEIAIKDVKKEMGLEFQEKTLKGLIEAAQKKAVDDAKLPADKKVSELTEKLTTLQKTVQEQEKTISDKDQQVQEVKLGAELAKAVPAGTSLAPDEVVGLMKLNGYEFKMEDGKLVAHKDGKPMQDKVTNPLPVSDVIAEFAKTKKLIADDGGGGGGDPQGRKKVNNGQNPKPTKLSELIAQYKETGKSTQGSEFMAEAERLAAENKDFDMAG